MNDFHQHKLIILSQAVTRHAVSCSKIFNGANNACSNKGLKDGAGAYSGNRRHQPTGGQKTFGSYNNVNKSDLEKGSIAKLRLLVVTTNKSTQPRYYGQCRYCDLIHWINECPKYRPVEERKRQLKVICYKCLKIGYMSKDCKKVKLVHTAVMIIHTTGVCVLRSSEEIQEKKKDIVFFWRKCAGVLRRHSVHANCQNGH